MVINFGKGQQVMGIFVGARYVSIGTVQFQDSINGIIAVRPIPAVPPFDRFRNVASNIITDNNWELKENLINNKPTGMPVLFCHSDTMGKPYTFGVTPYQVAENRSLEIENESLSVMNSELLENLRTIKNKDKLKNEMLRMSRFSETLKTPRYHNTSFSVRPEGRQI